jgi:hypothetical protein
MTPEQTLKRHAAAALQRAEESGSEDDLRRAKLLQSAWRPVGLSELHRNEHPNAWLLWDWWLDGSYGMTVGSEKTLKSWINLCEAFSIASGYPLFGRFKPHTSGPVLIFTGEGSADLSWKRLRHIGQAYGLSADQVELLPIQVVDDIGTTDSEAFRATLKLDLEMRQSVLIIVDPLYAYVGGDVEGSNVFDMGDRLRQISAVTVPARAALKIGHHARKLAPKQHPTLTDITQAGSREWVASWQLVSHREEPNLEEQAFKLRITIGSRLGHGADWDLDIRLGPFDPTTLEHEGKMSWALKPAAETQAEQQASKAAIKLQTDLLRLRKNGPMTASEYADKAGLSERRARDALKALVATGKASRDESLRYTAS